MNQEFFESRRDRVLEAQRSRDFQKSVILCRQLRNELLDEGQPDSVQLGWVRLHEFESLVDAKCFEDAYNLFHSEEGVTWVVSSSDYARMVANMPLLAAHMKLPDDIVSSTNDLLEAASKGDLPHPKTSLILRQACKFLADLGRSDLAPEFACPLIKIARLQGDEETLLLALEVLCHGLQSNFEADSFEVIMENLGHLVSIKSPKHQEAVEKLYGQIQNLILTAPTLS